MVNPVVGKAQCKRLSIVVVFLIVDRRCVAAVQARSEGKLHCVLHLMALHCKRLAFDVWLARVKGADV